MILAIGVCCLVFGCLGASPALAGPITLRYANFPPASTFPCVQMERWKKEVEKRTDGQVSIETYPGGTLLGAKNMLRGVMKGQADIGCLCMSYQPGVFPMTTVAELPVGFASSAVASRVLYELYRMHTPKEFAKVKVLALFTSAPTNIMSRVPVRSITDFTGLELRASGMASRVLDRLGATPVSMPMPETPEALQKGLVKGLMSSLEVMQDMNFAEYCPYVTRTDFQVYPFAVIMNKRAFDRLPVAVQKVLDDLILEQSVWTGRYMDEHVLDSLAWSQKTYGVETITLDREQHALMQEKLAPLIEEWKAKATDKGVDAEAVLADLYRLRDTYQP
ncbi:C4-dicarboxylate ABC transporter substrate-binding protein [Desulfoplanes formicivorans]|uniref:C4-dicarboxylate ABC transporter substrate-binding protein n=2 Tax=Desulfoplanes formicivorans TaxID=1592317 RepID=A0A194AL28_9BACT|nr:C4-dicarboxylate ABC transporter substrate-binding protein [Desulfoplanes formicivorans]